ncbi:MAG: type II toxin-antitoxin system RatA family toxin [Alphaproteobacteria bacterium]|nr:type II toxin-antitoxin system RatA family toxin [Alphaproteobacteria bacterium]
MTSSHTFHKILPYDPNVLFDLVADVEHYPQFVPGWVAARVIGRQGDIYETDQVVRIGGLSQRFRSHTTLDRPRLIEIRSDPGEAVDFHIVWTFEQLPEHHCDAGVLVEVNMRLGILDRIARSFSRQALKSMVDAFERRATHQTSAAS